MDVRFFVFDETEERLYATLEMAGWPRERFFGLFDPLEPLSSPPKGNGSNNPWRATDAWGKEIPIDGPLGFGEAYLGKKDDVISLFEDLDKIKAGHLAGVDVPLGQFAAAPAWEHWCSGRGAGGSFGLRGQGDRLIGAKSLSDRGLTGKNVNIFVVDQGLSKDCVQRLGGNFGGGLSWPFFNPKKTPGEFDHPFQKEPREHGNMIVRNVLALAPDARIFDVPLLPERIDNVRTFTLEAAFAYVILLAWFKLLKGRTVIVNPWGIYDRFREPILGEYTTNPNHPFNFLVDLMAQTHDVIFAAGNSGQFCPNTRSGAYDRGPGRSIWGANALHRVVSVGAARADSTWVGASSQGPGPAALGNNVGINEKPDLCAPSWFREDHDANLTNTGTSAACAVAAGAVAALRENWSVSPDEMKSALRAGAQKFWHSDWNGRMGEGVLNLPGTIGHLP